MAKFAQVAPVNGKIYAPTTLCHAISKKPLRIPASAVTIFLLLTLQHPVLITMTMIAMLHPDFATHRAGVSHLISPASESCTIRRTYSPLTGSGTLSRKSRVVHNGALTFVEAGKDVPRIATSKPVITASRGPRRYFGGWRRHGLSVLVEL